VNPCTSKNNCPVNKHLVTSFRSGVLKMYVFTLFLWCTITLKSSEGRRNQN
jgi:hypothetical protein